MAADLTLAFNELASNKLASNPQSDTSLAPTTAPATQIATPVYLRATAETQNSDLNLDGLINHRDAHAVISFLNARSNARPIQLLSPLASEGESSTGAKPQATHNSDYDVNADGEVGPLDVLWIVNQIKEYDPLTPCDCAICSRPTLEGRCENASLAQTQAANLAPIITLAPEADFASQSLASLVAAQSIDDLLRTKRT